MSESNLHFISINFQYSLHFHTFLLLLCLFTLMFNKVNWLIQTKGFARWTFFARRSFFTWWPWPFFPRGFVTPSILFSGATAIRGVQAGPFRRRLIMGIYKLKKGFQKIKFHPLYTRSKWCEHGYSIQFQFNVSISQKTPDGLIFSCLHLGQWPMTHLMMLSDWTMSCQPWPPRARYGQWARYK